MCSMFAKKTRDAARIISRASLSTLVVLIAGCEPYNFHKGEEFNAGPVNAVDFPPPYQGVGASTLPDGRNPGRGTFTEINAYINDADAGYYSFPFTANQLANNASTALRVLEDGAPYARIPTPVAYVFDPAPPLSPFPSSPRCNAPPNYTYDRDNDVEGMRLDDQGNIFTQLPFVTSGIRPGQTPTWTYVPIVQEVAVRASGYACQAFKSERKVKSVLGSLPATGNYLLWAIIDPSSGVYRVGQVGGNPANYTLPDGRVNPAWSTGLDVQKWGWFGQYYLAYIDGGYIPLDPPRTVRESNRDKQVVNMTTQPLYFPSKISSNPTVQCGTPPQSCAPGLRCVSGSCAACTADNQCGTGGACDGGKCYQTITGNNAAGPFKGYDVLRARRGENGYSPVCQLFRYNTDSAHNGRGRLISELPKSEDAMLGLTRTAVAGSSADPRPYIFCPQAN